jgi:hypothetical protein
MAADEGLTETLARRGGLRDVIKNLLPDMPADEAAWFDAIPDVQQEAMRAVINEVVASDGALELDVQFTPAYDYAVKIFDFDTQVVIRVSGPLTGGSSARQMFTGA